MSQSKEYLNYIHYFRGFAILVIVGIHCRLSLNWGTNDFDKQLFTTALDNGTILFVFIAGFLFQYLKEKYNYHSYLTRKAKYVLLPYLLVSLLPIMLKVLNIHQGDWIPDEMVPENPFGEFFFYLTTGKHLGPFWFIPMIAIFYVISPLILKLDNEWFYQWIFPILLIASLFTYKFGFFTSVWVSFLHFIPVFIFGMWAAHYHTKLIGLNGYVLTGLIILYLGLSAAEIAGWIPVPKIGSFEENATMPLFAFNIVKLRVYILSIILIRVFYCLNDRKIPLLKFLGDYSFGIYFVHIFIIKAIQLLVLKLYPEFTLNWFTFLIYVTIISVLSIIAVRVIKIITGRYSRMVIGS